MRLRPVNARATRIALITASVPDDTKRSFSMEGTACTINAASSASAAVDAPKLVPFPAATRTASTTAGAAWPRIIGPHEPKKSM